MLVIRQDNFAFLPCSTSKLTIFRMLRSFRIDIFRLRQEIKMAECFRISPFFCVVLTEKIILKPIHPYDQPAKGMLSVLEEPNGLDDRYFSDIPSSME